MKYYGGRDISDEDLENALLVGMSPHEKRRMRKKRGLSFNPSSKNVVSDKKTKSSNGHLQLSSSKKPVSVDMEDELEDSSVLDSDVNSELNGPVPASSDGAVFATCSSKLSLLGHGLHGKQVVDYLLKEYGEDGIREFCQRWRQVFVEAINPRFLPAGWDVTHRYVAILYL